MAYSVESKDESGHGSVYLAMSGPDEALAHAKACVDRGNKVVCIKDDAGNVWMDEQQVLSALHVKHSQNR